MMSYTRKIKIYKVLKDSIQGVPPTGKSDENYELLELDTPDYTLPITTSSVLNVALEAQDYKAGDIVIIEEDDELPPFSPPEEIIPDTDDPVNLPEISEFKSVKKIPFH